MPALNIDEVVVILSESLVGILLVVALAVAAILLVAVVVLMVQMRRMRRAYRNVMDPDSGEDVFEALARLNGDLGQLREDLGIVHGNTEHIRDLQRDALSRVGVVRYDAFDDMGGALSFSAAMLDEHANGVVFSAINGRTETRTYAKPIVGGESEYNLSPEEVSALKAAIEATPGKSPRESKGRRRKAAS